MKDLIKKLLREGIINEKLTNVDSDVNMIYDTYFKNDIDEIQRTGIITENMFQKNQITTKILKDSESIEVNRINPCLIKINYGGSSYSPTNQILSFSINYSALNYVFNSFNGNLKEAIDDIWEPDKKNSLANEFTEERVKGSIHHELAHWIDDTMHNGHIKNRINKAMAIGTRDFKNIPIDSTKMEIEGQIHNIKQLHNKYKNVWDTLTFEDLISKSPTLNNVLNTKLRNNTDIRTKWIRDIKTRMYREGLLGKNMVN
jgi:hypothetical protein